MRLLTSLNTIAALLMMSGPISLELLTQAPTSEEYLGAITSLPSD